MQFSDLPFPVTFVAPDGWAHNAKRPEDMREWSATAIQKYSRIGFIIADSNGSAWRLTRIDPERKITLLDRLRGIFQHRKFAVRITVEAAEGDPLTVFRECFSKALEGDDDCLTQGHSREKLFGVLNGATSLPTLLKTLHKMRVT